MKIAELRNLISENQDALLSYAKKTYTYLDIKEVYFHTGYKAIVAEMTDTSLIQLSKANLSKNDAFKWVENQIK